MILSCPAVKCVVWDARNALISCPDVYNLNQNMCQSTKFNTNFSFIFSHSKVEKKA